VGFEDVFDFHFFFSRKINVGLAVTSRINYYCFLVRANKV